MLLHLLTFVSFVCFVFAACREERESVVTLKSALPEGRLPVGMIQEARKDGIKQGTLPTLFPPSHSRL